jgi:hypothetical protein
MSSLTSDMAKISLANVRNDNRRLHAEAGRALAAATALRAEMCGAQVRMDARFACNVASTTPPGDDDADLGDESCMQMPINLIGNASRGTMVHDQLRHELLVHAHLTNERDRHIQECEFLRERLARNNVLIADLSSLNSSLHVQLQHMRDVAAEQATRMV